MELCTVAPCFDCGNLEQELADLAAGRHEYRWYEIFGQRIILCDFCDVDFGSYYPDFFGLPGARPGAANYQLRFIKQVWNPQSETDHVCKACRRRLAFLKFLAAARQANSL